MGTSYTTPLLQPIVLYLCLAQLLANLRHFLEYNLVGFQLRARIAIDGFLHMLEKYLSRSAVELGDTFVMHSGGVCIRYKMAPFLSEVYLNTLDCVG